MTYPEVQFVAAPEEGAEVLFDFNDSLGPAPAAIVAGSFTLGAPSVDGDPDGLGVQYGSREVGFTLLVYGSRYAALQTQTSLARAFMLRRRGWLRVRLDPLTAPVWLRTYTPTPAELDFALIQPDSDEDAWQIEVTVAAEPFIRGERVDLWSGTIYHDPAAATNPMQVLLPPVTGDAPAPLMVVAAFSGDRREHSILWATAAVPEDYEPVAWQIGTDDGWLLSADVSAPELSENFSEGSYRHVTFDTVSDLTPRISGPAPSAPAPGCYKVLVRVARLGSDGVFNLQLGYRRSEGDHYFGASPVVPFDPKSSQGVWLEMGEFDYPLPRPGGTVLPVAPYAPGISLAASRESGSGTLALDAFLLVPVDIAGVENLESWEKSDALVSSFGTRGPRFGEIETQVWDGDAETSFRRTTTGLTTDATTNPATRGRFPTVRPGVQNLLTLAQQTRGVGGATPISPAGIPSTADVSLSYQPRWLWLGGA